MEAPDVPEGPGQVGWTPWRAMASAAEQRRPRPEPATATIDQLSASDGAWAAALVHHLRTGVEMSELAMARAMTEELRQFAAASKSAQGEYLPDLQQIVDTAGATATSHKSVIPRMNRLQLETLRSLADAAFDQHWITIASGHHMSAAMLTAVAMAGSGSDGGRALQAALLASHLRALGRLCQLMGSISD
jgi:uncharacterized protein (DUF305 family)